MAQDGSRSFISSNPSEGTPAALFGSKNRARRLSRSPVFRLCFSVGDSAFADIPRSETLGSRTLTGGPGVAPRCSLSGSRRAFNLGKSALNQTFPEPLEVIFKVMCPQKDPAAIF